jgi:hypothetical protein
VASLPPDSIASNLYDSFFLRSAQRFFIANDSRLLPSGVRPPRFFALIAGGRGVAKLVFLAVRGDFFPSSSAMAPTEPISFLLQVRGHSF